MSGGGGGTLEGRLRDTPPLGPRASAYASSSGSIHGSASMIARTLGDDARPFRRLLREQRRHERVVRRAELRAEVARSRDGRVQVLGHEIGARERQDAGEHAKRDHAERVEVRRCLGPSASRDLFGRHERERPHHRPGERRPEVGEVRHAEVADLHVAGRAEEDVRRLEIAVDDAAPVYGLEPREHRPEHVGDRRHREGPLARRPDALFEGAARHVLHDEERAVRIELEDAHHVRMVEPGSNPCLAREAHVRVAPRGAAADGQHLHGHVPIVKAVVREQHSAGRSGAERTDHPVATGEQPALPAVASPAADAAPVAELLGEEFRRR